MLAPRRPTMPFFGGATPVKFDPRSLALLGQANPVLAQILRETERRAADRGITLGVGEVKRSPARQAEMVVTGKSQTYNSRHLNGSAADLVIKGPDGKPNWDFEAYRPVAAIAKEVAAEQGVPDFVWGGDWKTLKDGVHFQVGGPVKGNQAGKDTPTRGLVIAPGGETDKLQTGGFLSRILPQENGQSAFWNKVPGLSDPDKRAKLALALDGMTLNPNQGLQKGLVADIEGRAQTKQRNATAEWLRSQGNEELAAAVEAGSLAGDQAIGLHYEQRKPAAPVELQHFTGPDGLEYSYNPLTGETAPLNTGAPIPKEPATSDDIREYEYAKREAAAQGKPPPPPFSEWIDARRAAGASKINIGGDSDQVNVSPVDTEAIIGAIDDIMNDPALGRVTGTIAGGGGNDVSQIGLPMRLYYGSDGIALIEKIGQLEGSTFLAARQFLKGGGAITDFESRKAENAMARLNRAKSKEEYIAALKDFRDAVVAGQAKLRQQNGQAPVAPEDDAAYLKSLGLD